MSSHALLSDLRNQGLQLTPDGGSIRVRGPEDALTADVQERIREAKPALLRRLREQRECQRVAERIHEVTPEGLGKWDPALEYVREPSDAFLDALDAWLDRGTSEARRDLQEAADALVRAWREAGQRFEAEGRPETRKEVHAL